ncbi:MAG: hypothetical protein K8L91_22880 [Anaerolineae bacterium]|nr:hypothetical protein [Anaerolineae bacterium]
MPIMAGYADANAILEFQVNPLVLSIRLSCIPLHFEAAQGSQAESPIIDEGKLHPEVLEAARNQGMYRCGAGRTPAD